MAGFEASLLRAGSGIREQAADVVDLLGILCTANPRGRHRRRLRRHRGPLHTLARSTRSAGRYPQTRPGSASTPVGSPWPMLSTHILVGSLCEPRCRRYDGRGTRCTWPPASGRSRLIRENAAEPTRRRDCPTHHERPRTAPPSNGSRCWAARSQLTTITWRLQRKAPRRGPTQLVGIDPVVAAFPELLDVDTSILVPGGPWQAPHSDVRPVVGVRHSAVEL